MLVPAHCAQLGDVAAELRSCSGMWPAAARLLLQKLRRLSRCHELVLKLAQLLGSGDAGCPSALR